MSIWQKILNDQRAVVAAYAAIISTVSLIWSIVNTLMMRKSKLKVDMTFAVQMVQILNHLTGHTPALKIVVTNRGNSVRYMDKPIFKISRFLHKSKYLEPVRVD